MAEKGFGVKEVNLIGASGTPTITSPNNLNLNAVNVAISTNATVGGTLSVTGNVSVGGTLTYEDVTNIDSVGLITARSGLIISGVTTFNSDVDFKGSGGSTKILFDTSQDQLEFADSATLTFGNHSTTGDYSISYVNGADFTILGMNGGSGDLVLGTFASGTTTKTLVSKRSNNALELYFANNKKLETTNTGVTVTGTLAATAVTGDGSGLSNVPATDPTNSDIQVVYTVTANGSSAYRFAGNGIVSTEDDPDVYLIRGFKYRFINNSGGSHPFQIREASGGSAYSSGVTNNGASSGNIDFQVPYSAPSHLYYQCTSHSGMVGNIYIRGAGGNNTNVGVTTFSGFTHIKTAVINTAYQTIESTATNSYPYLRLKNDAREYQLSCHGGQSDSFNIYDGTAAAYRFTIGSDGQATFDKGAPGSSNQVISRFQAESSRRLDIVWHDSGSLMGFDTPGNHSYIFKVNGTERARLTGTDATISGATDGVLNLTTSDSRGSFIRYQQGGTSKAWVGCGQGLSLGDVDDLGLRATDKIRFRPGSDHTFILDGAQLRHGSSAVVAGGLDDVRIRNSSSYKGFVLRGTGGSGGMANYDEYCFLFNRMGSDGNIITFNAQGSQEGSISVVGSSVAYNGGVLTRWSQLVGISTNNKADRPTIYQGTVMSNLDEMCEWPEEENMQLNKTEVSTASGDKNVAGVFWAWDDDDDTYVNDFYVAQTGDYIIRVGATTTVTRGDLLESAGDGTAKPQSDDIVRSKTVAKVTSGIAHTTYPDGTKTYPCVLMGS